MILWDIVRSTMICKKSTDDGSFTKDPIPVDRTVLPSYKRIRTVIIIFIIYFLLSDEKNSDFFIRVTMLSPFSRSLAAPCYAMLQAPTTTHV